MTIADDLRQQIISGQLSIGDQVATEAALCSRYSVSRMTARQAVNSLVTGGYLTRRRGKGTFVTSDKAERSASHLLGFAEDTRNRGLEPVTRVLHQGLRSADREARQLLDLPAGTQLLTIDRLRSVNSEPIGINHILLLDRWSDAFGDQDFTGSFYRIIHQVLDDDVRIAQQRVEAVQANAEQAALLGIAPGSALLRIIRVTYLQKHGLIGLTRTFYRGDRYFLSLQVSREAFTSGSSP
jgi:GntR family transcriptional regulator